MIVQNRTILRTCPFDDYLKLPGRSHSDIRSEGQPFTATPKMLLGTDVHNYLLEPEKYNHENRDIVRPLALELLKALGTDKFFKMFEAELAVIANFIHEGFDMLYKGRGDLVIVKKIVIDFKVSDVPLKVSVPRFGYDNSLSGYALGFDCPIAIIVRVSPKSIAKGKPETESYNVPIRHEWWNYQIIQKGKPML